MDGIGELTQARIELGRAWRAASPAQRTRMLARVRRWRAALDAGAGYPPELSEPSRSDHSARSSDHSRDMSER